MPLKIAMVGAGLQRREEGKSGFIFCFFRVFAPLRSILICGILLTSLRAAAAEFHVSFDQSLRSEPATGRLLLYLIRPNSGIGEKAEPAGDYFFSNPQPIFGIDVHNLAPGQIAIINDSADSFPDKLSTLPPGHYRAQLLLDMHRDSGSWRHEPGNLYSPVIPIDITSAAQVIDLKLTKVVEPRQTPTRADVEIIDIKSNLLSNFRDKETHLRAGIVLPIDYDPHRHYAALYQIPGFGGDHFGAFARADAIRKLAANDPRREFYKDVFWIVLDPDGPNGHTLFADSDVNGPCGQALVEELIPAIEKRYPALVAKKEARLLHGHSSGGFAVVWLAVNYPDTFGACWALSPDPISFHRLERINIYDQANAYVDRDSTKEHQFDTPSDRTGGKPVCTVRIENAMEQVVGPDNTSAGQWDSWQAVFGHRKPNGNPAELFDPATGIINKSEAEYYKHHDIEQLLRANPEKIGQIFRQRIRLIAGSQDNYYLNEAVEYLKITLEQLHISTPENLRHGYIQIIPGATHGTITSTPQAHAFEQEVLDHLRESKVIP